MLSMHFCVYALFCLLSTLNLVYGSFMNSRRFFFHCFPTNPHLYCISILLFFIKIHFSMTTSPPNHRDESPPSPRVQDKKTPFSIPSSRRCQKSPSPSLYTSPHRRSISSSNPTTPSRLTPYRSILTPHRPILTPHRPILTPHRTTPRATTPGGRRNETPDLRNTLRRRYTSLDYRPHHTNHPTTTAASPITRRTQSLANLDSKRDTTLESKKGEEPWTREHWLLLSSYYEDMNRDVVGTAEVFYRHESLCSVETETGRKVIIELWPPHKVRRKVKCLEIAAKRHHGMPLQDRITAFEERNRKRVRSELEKDLLDDLSEEPHQLKKPKKATDE
ncbi:hypothetical protein BX666DRAFT_1469566 [Dichotomocladium elegans]|nr:hypothetical protein BX666DRAFT_1469566 [Dichotomocladium elegans]